MRVSSLYIHVPFCLRKCNYCDFISFPLEGRHEQLAEYPQLLKRELELYKSKDLELDLETIYFGGGTPSLLDPAAVADLLHELPAAAEITMEANPETVNEQLLCDFRQAGINRLSLGVQSFNDDLLLSMGRGHSAEQACNAVSWARRAGFENIGIDLIYGLPNQTLEQWQQDVEQALFLHTEHISLYCLSVEPGTAWGELAQAGKLCGIDDDLSADMLEFTIRRLTEAGFHHYEISNFARPGYESRHNCCYWQRDNYLGLGVAAAGCLTNHRIYNVKTWDEYAAKLEQHELPLEWEEFLSVDEVMSEAVFLGLRLVDGISRADFRERYGVDVGRRFRKQIARLEKKGLLECNDDCLRLTGRGLMLGNQAFAEFV